MLQNYLKVTLRNLSRNLIFVIINIIALGLALSLCIVAYLNGKYDADWDGNHLNGEAIFRINMMREIQGRQQPFGITPVALASSIGQNYSGVGAVIRYNGSYSPLKVGEDNFNKRIGYVDPEFMDVFTVPIVEGRPDALADRQNILISETIASIYFGREDPLGRIMSVFNDEGEEFTYTVGGVFEDNPLNSSFYYEVLTSFENYIDMFHVDEMSWRSWIASTFLFIPDPERAEILEDLIQDIVPVHNQADENWQISAFRLQPLYDMGHDSWEIWDDWWVRVSFHPAAVKAPPIMALLILLIACFNFTNTAIAFSSRRLKEIGIRKVSGGHRKQIIAQFMTENFILTLFGLMVALLISPYLVRLYSSLWEYMDLEFSLFDNIYLILFLLALLLITTIFAGAYPSFNISRFNPVYIFQDKLKIGGKNVLSVVLLTLQIGISVMAMNSGVLYIQNARFQDRIYLGYDKDDVICMYLSGSEHFIPLRDELRTNPLIRSIGESRHHLGRNNYSIKVSYEDIEENVGMLDIGDNYFETMGLKLIEGRSFTDEYEKTDIVSSIIVNEKFVEDFGIMNPIGKRVVINDSIPLYIVGVVMDFYPYGVWDDIPPGAFRRASSDRMRYLAVNAGDSDLEEVNRFMEAKWKELIPNQPYEGFFQEEMMQEGRQINKNIQNIYLALAAMALFLSAIGLYTLVSLSVIRRTKEVGIRKVVGGTILRIILILSLPYLIVIMIASLIGLAGGYYSSMIMMKSIWDVHADATAATFMVPVLIILLVALTSIGGKVYEAASRNPTESLRYE